MAGRKSIDGERRNIRIQVRLCPADAALLDAVRGDMSRNEFVARSIRLGAAQWPMIRDQDPNQGKV